MLNFSQNETHENMKFTVIPFTLVNFFQVVITVTQWYVLWNCAQSLFFSLVWDEVHTHKTKFCGPVCLYVPITRLSVFSSFESWQKVVGRRERPPDILSIWGESSLHLASIADLFDIYFFLLNSPRNDHFTFNFPILVGFTSPLARRKLARAKVQMGKHDVYQST